MIGELVASGAETGLQVAVLHEGEVIVDAVAGLADPHTARPVTADTLFFAASTGKGVAAAVAHTLVDRGALSYEQRVADIWPEFSAHGKDRVTSETCCCTPRACRACGRRSRRMNSAIGTVSAPSSPISRRGGRPARPPAITL